ncbi:D-alanyl-D-alanine carboxypeptidase [Sporosarcina sp. BI001-red]|uniref:D-alanyl-D-alanine carboxypeptidase family protein n=1 Tax=Sporosarcina sp. BI001-red TaxID=2282866 RepID=UPI000E25C028|nr:serine hydrolase [Sporosarcina sp. BI001-red]REB05163.1 D-alanyl-D-alanine carboxypeptidase [Sporosarcina sp. BI001-red]
MRKLWAFLKGLVLFIVVLSIALNVTGWSGKNSKESLDDYQTDRYASPYIYMVERVSGKAVYEKNANEKAYPASLTKMMTTIVALEHIENLSASAPVDTDTYQKMVAQNASMAGFYGREKVTYRDLLYGTILPSGGEASNSLAIHVAGSTKQFVQLMNEKAAELGMTRTHFMNPEGLDDPKQYTTASDMAKLLNYALDNQNFKAILTKGTFQTTSTAEHPQGIALKSTVLSSLTTEVQDGFKILGGKSGTTYDAGQCWATFGTAGNREYISIVMGAPLADISHPDHAQKKDTLELFADVSASE